MRPFPTIRQCVPSDAPILVDLGRNTFWSAYRHVMDHDQLASYINEAFTLDRIKDELEVTRSTFFIAEIDGSARVGLARSLGAQFESYPFLQKMGL